MVSKELLHRSVEPSKRLHSSPASTPPIFPNHHRPSHRYSTVIKDGILEKWTNYLGTWRSRYFILEPGVLKYAHAPGQPIKETYPLALCTSRFCTKDHLCLELEHPHGTLYLKMPNAREKKSWLDAFLQAKNAFLYNSTGQLQRSQSGPQTLQSSSPSPLQQETTTISLGGSTSCIQVSCRDMNQEFNADLTCDAFQPLDEDKAPMILLLEHIKSSMRSLESVSGELKRAQSAFLNLVTHLRDPQFRQTGRVAIAQLLEVLDHLNVVVHRFFKASKTLAHDELSQRRALENSIAILAQDYYEMNSKLNLIKEKLSPVKHNIHHAIELVEKHITLQEDPSDATSSCIVSCISQPSETKPPLTLAVNQTDAPKGSDPSVHLERPPELLSSLLPYLKLVESLNHVLHLTPYASYDDQEEDTEFFDLEDDVSENVTVQPDSLTPLPLPSPDQVAQTPKETPVISRRTRLPKPRTQFNISLWNVIKDFIGRDLSRIALPIYFNEPTSFVQRLAEDFSYTSLLEQAAKCQDTLDMFRFVAVFSVTPCASTIGRTYKPFNSLLGETYELTHRGFNFLAEQVSHHPPMTAYSVRGKGFDAWGHLMVKTRFCGKSIEIFLFGPSHIAFLSDSTHDSEEQKTPGYSNHFTVQRCKASVNNVIFGKLTLEMCDTVLLTNHTTGDCCIIEYLASGWWTNRVPCVVRGVIFDNQGVARFKIGGRWDHQLWTEQILSTPQNTFCIDPPQPVDTCTELNSENSPPLTDENAYLCTESGLLCKPKYLSRNISKLKVPWDDLMTDSTTRQILWQREARSPEASMFYQFSQFTMELNELSPDYDPSCGAAMPLTDSRFRMDQRYLEEGLIDFAIKEKERLEIAQRDRARANHLTNTPHSPQWFKPSFDPFSMQDTWVATGQYWVAKQQNNFPQSIHLFR